jgi:hypothetical protein
VHRPDPHRAKGLQPRDFGVEVVGVHVQVNPRLAVVQPLHEQPQVVAVQRRPVILVLRKREPGEHLPERSLPERQLAVVLRGRNVDDHLGQPAEMRHIPIMVHSFQLCVR